MPLHEILSFKLSLSECAAELESRWYHSVSTCTIAVHSFQNPVYSAVFVVFTATCFFACVYGKYDTIKSQLTQIFVCYCKLNHVARFIYLCISNDQLSSSLSGYTFCYIFLCTCVYKISKFAHNTYTKPFSGLKSKNVREYRICKFVHGSYH